MAWTRRSFGLSIGAAVALGSPAVLAQRGQVIRVAWLDPLTGLMAPVGQNQIKSFQFMAEHFSRNNPAGVRFEMVPFDNKLSPAESLNVLKAAIDQGIRYVVQGNGSGAALAISDAVTKHNERNPGREVVYLNYAAVDPDLTNSRCSYWHFRLDADTSMKMEALTTYMRDQRDIRRVYLINQNYAHGVQVARYAKEALARKRPDIQIVGEDLHPLAQVRDFAPYIAKIKASGADTVITGNWGSDLALLVPELTVGLPGPLTAATGFDALTHAIEAYLSPRANPFTDALALDAARRIIHWLPEAMDRPDDLTAREQMLAAAAMAAQAFNSAQLGACHAVAHALGGLYDVPHGVANALMLPAVMAFNEEACRVRWPALTLALGGADPVALVTALRARLRLPERLSQVGVTAVGAELIAAAMGDPFMRLNPRPVREADVASWLEAVR